MRLVARAPALALTLALACGGEDEAPAPESGSLCACRELDGVEECCFGHGTCAAQPEGPSVCACDEGARGETCSTPAPGVHAVRERSCVGDDPGCARAHDHVLVEHFDSCVDLDQQRFDSIIVRPASGPEGGWPGSDPIPLAVLTHGASQDPADYYDLLEHLAANGIVAAAFDASAGGDVVFRANRLLSYLGCLRTQWGEAARLGDSLGLVGHSRGGAAVALAADAIEAGLASVGFEVLALVALAPSQTGQFALPAAATPAYFTLQGSRDPDTRGASLGWFDLAGQGEPAFVRGLAWVFGATHHRFHQGLLFGGSGELQASLSAEGHWTVARAYVGGFLIWRLLGHDGYRDHFTGAQVPASVAASWAQDPELFAGLTDGVGGRLVVHDFDADTLSPSPLGGMVSTSGFASVSLGQLDELDAPWSGSHRGRGLRLDTVAGQSGSIEFELPPASADLSAFAVLGLRVARSFDTEPELCAAPGPVSALSVVLSDDAGEVELPLATLGQAARVAAPDRVVPETFGNWVDPDCHAHDFLRPIRIPLQSFCAGGLDPTTVRSIELRVEGDGGGLLLDELVLERGEGESASCE